MAETRILLFIDPNRIGGMASHSRKLGKLLSESQRQVYFKKQTHLFLLNRRGHHNIILIYSTKNIKRLALAILAKMFGVKVVVRIGGLKILEDNKALLNLLMRMTDYFIFVNSVISSFVCEIGTVSHEVLPGFIPQQRKSSDKKFDISMTFMSTKEDTYNLDSIQMVASTGMSVVLGYYGKPLNKIPSEERKKLLLLQNMPNVTIEWHNHNFEEIASKSKLHVRLTRADGDSNIVREMLYNKVPVVCSKVVPRPTGATVVSIDAKLTREYLNKIIRKSVPQSDDYEVEAHLRFINRVIRE